MQDCGFVNFIYEDETQILNTVHVSQNILFGFLNILKVKVIAEVKLKKK